MNKNIWNSVQEIYDAIAEHQGVGTSGRLARVLKLAEESGEAAEAVINCLDMNKRKGSNVTGLEVSEELCDVIITAMVALHDWSFTSPRLMLEMRLSRIVERVRTEGS